MNRRGICLVVLLVTTLLAGWPANADGLRSIGVRFVLPIGNVPLFLGIEATVDVPFGVLVGAFSLTASGKVLITGSYDLRLNESAEGSKTFVRLTTGLSYFDLRAFLPSLLIGGGLALEAPLSPALAVCPAAEFLYPVAFPVPMVSASGRWVFP